MQSIDATSYWSVANLAKSLRQEYLLISNEQSSYLNLQETYEQNYCETQQLLWICSRQRQILKDLVLAKSEAAPALAYRQADMTKHIGFINIYQCKAFNYLQTVGIVDLLNFLYESPATLACCLSAADSSEWADVQLDMVIHFVINGLYGGVIHAKDAEMLIKLFQVLVETQIAIGGNPRKFLRSQSSFSRVYQKYHESTHATKIFLKTVLFEPIMSVLMEDERRFEATPQKKTVGSTTKRAPGIDKESSSECVVNSVNCEQLTTNQMHVHVAKFIKSISDNWLLLPSTLRWLYQWVYRTLAQAKLPKKDINTILSDMIFTNFICPAIQSPNIHGIIDASISENSRFNLKQIGQILQILTLSEDQPLDASKYRDVLNKFEKNCISAMLEQFYMNDTSKQNNSNPIIQYHSSAGTKLILVTLEELATSIKLMEATLQHHSLPISDGERRKLKQMIEPFSDLTEAVLGIPCVASELPSCSSESKHNSKVRNRLTGNKSSNSSLAENSERKGNSMNISAIGSGTVLIIPLASNDDKRLLTEEELLNNIPCKESARNSEENYADQINLEDKKDNNKQSSRDKQKSFSLQDDASLGNTSDNLEAVSEAHSNHSVASSLELEEADQNDNDNLSDMISANVSGRGSPNISGRDTPSSQVTEGGGEVQQFATPHMTKISNKARSDIEDKFCKFEIKKLIEGDETISIISDTWSTDVLASDSEALEANDRNFSTPLIPAMPLLPGDHNYIPLTSNFGQLRIGNIDLETQSESAWSTDALVDTDDIQSMTSRFETADNISKEQEMFLGSSVSVSKSGHFRNMNNNSHQELTNCCTANEILPMEQNCSRPTQVRQSSTDSFMSTDGSAEIRTNSNRSYQNENTAKICKRGDKSKLNINACCDSKPNNEIETNNEIRASSKPDQMSDVMYCNFSSTNCNDNKTAIEGAAREGASDLTSTCVDEDMVSVEHRRLSSEQRNAKFDSRRNGMMDIPRNFSGLSSFTSNPTLTTPLTALNNPERETNELVTSKEVMPITPQDDTSALPNLTSPCLIKMAQSAKKESFVSLANPDKGFLSQSIDREEKGNRVACYSFDTPAVKDFLHPEKVTGTIPKSISFDLSADKIDRNESTIVSIPGTSRSSNALKTHGGFFTKIKLGFKNRRSINGNNKLRFSYTSNNSYVISINGNDAFSTVNTYISNANDSDIMHETTEDILAKYRRKTSSSSETVASDSTSNNSSSTNSKNAHSCGRNPSERNDLDYSTTFAALKRKLRQVLSTSDIYPSDFEPCDDGHATSLLMYLRILQSQALSNQALQQLSCTSEILRVMQTVKAEAQQNLLMDLQNDIYTRQTYIQYLISCRQTLLSSTDNLNSFTNNLQQESRLIVYHIMMIVAKHFLEKKEKMVQKFHREFVKLTVVDEKIDMLHEFLKSLTDDLRADTVIDYMSDSQFTEAQDCMECILLQKLYQSVMFPNNDGDIFRDQVLFDHIKRLSRSISPSHKMLRISSAYLGEAPWPYAQRQLSYISAYKTPNEKVECVFKCMKSLISLLSMGSDRSITADDMTPVFIYVLIQVNPPNLLSTIEYVNSFFGDKLAGERAYWWTQFCSAVTFIKTMDYCE
ncbi:receptor-mediated endocytosis protein 6 homolog [Toxorhynchites rutilus septentrionalis]|uniref:receptor-mediated endocytosis protein 6 homolog n=1 Tax=Toxorhynchites rutilus septentrionalis TaxID=329112 RepID=UPI002479221C|nr:receptor-mediated endocytosis protein 6 homolog [Toxorhynchites rutilus septentrionalis]